VCVVHVFEGQSFVLLGQEVPPHENVCAEEAIINISTEEVEEKYGTLG